MTVDPASFRDRAGQVHRIGDRIFRTVQPAGLADYEFVRDSGALAPLMAEGVVLGAEEVDAADLGADAPTGGLVLEHRRLPFWSYPYEWPFGALKAAALAHLDIQIRLLAGGVSLSDASAYNIQFQGPCPIFIDLLSFRRYRKNEHWAGYRQFCEQFLNPLLLRAKFGVAFQEWYRGRPEGISTDSLARLARWRHHLSLRMLAHVIMPARLQAWTGDVMLDKAIKARARGLPLSNYRALLVQLRNWIARLRPKATDSTLWSGYADNASGQEGVAKAKRAMVADFVRSARPSLLLDLGCNTGDYAACALHAGAAEVVGLDADHGALEQAFARAQRDGLNFLPLHQDCANPSPNQGWNASEHRSLAERCAGVDAVIALAFEHHLAIGRNIPLAEVVSWITSLAPRGLIEFVHKDDPTVRKMLALREDIFDDYSVETFAAVLRRHARIVTQRTVSQSGRVLFWFERPMPK